MVDKTDPKRYTKDGKRKNRTYNTRTGNFDSEDGTSNWCYDE